jgi:SOS-response transcriptional repressor LexA
VRQGEPVNEKHSEMVAMPAALIDKGEIVFRVRGDKLRDCGIEDGDLLIVQLRQKGRAATGELAIAKIGPNVFIGRWWQKHNRKALLTDALTEIALGKGKATIKIVAVVNAIVRVDDEA